MQSCVIVGAFTVVYTRHKIGKNGNINNFEIRRVHYRLGTTIYNSNDVVILFY